MVKGSRPARCVCYSFFFKWLYDFGYFLPFSMKGGTRFATVLWCDGLLLSSRESRMCL